MTADRHTDPSSACTNDPGEHCDLCDGEQGPCTHPADEIVEGVCYGCRTILTPDATYTQSGDYYYLNADTLATGWCAFPARDARTYPATDAAPSPRVDGPTCHTGDAAPLTRDDARYAITEAGLRALQSDATAFGSEWC